MPDHPLVIAPRRQKVVVQLNRGQIEIDYQYLPDHTISADVQLKSHTGRLSCCVLFLAVNERGGKWRVGAEQDFEADANIGLGVMKHSFRIPLSKATIKPIVDVHCNAFEREERVRGHRLG